jgi:hypothetical protein
MVTDAFGHRTVYAELEQDLLCRFKIPHDDDFMALMVSVSAFAQTVHPSKSRLCFPDMIMIRLGNKLFSF